jgi:hypothetical protein
MFQRLKMSYVDGSLALGDYMYAVAAHQQIIEYIPEYIDCYDSDSDICRLNVALNDCSIEELNETQAAIIRATELELSLFEKN